ncbi:MAG: alpha/beta fold hydrolase [Gammaproteobacteria bacterium]|nr:alpha/beta fold hydrolase [Gammaproteobacteria bacterium]
MKKLLIILAIAGVLAGGYYAFRLAPLVTTDNTGADKVVLLHGLGRTETAMLLLESALTEAGFDVHSFGYPSTEQPPAVLLELVSEQIDSCCRDSDHTVHFVGHSLGGLLIRAYLANGKPDNLGRVVLLGTPNKGSELADEKPDEPIGNSIVELAGPTAQALRTGPDGFAASLPPPNYPVGVIAGTRDNPVSNEWLPVPNDGMVSVDSARLDGMTDFIAVNVSHYELRSNLDVAAQVIEFLLRGKFEHGQ